MPSMPWCSGWSSGHAPLPSSVLTIGAWSFSASFMIAGPAPEITAPWPTYSTGLRLRRDQRRGLLQRVRVRVSGDGVAGQVHLLDERRRARRAGHVLGQIDQHRPGAPRRRQVERLARDARDVVRVLHQVGMLHHRVGDAGDVGLLEGVLAQHRRDGLAGEHDHRARIHQRGQQAGHRVGRARARGHQHDARLAGRTRVAVRHVRRALLVADEDQLDLRVDERVEDRHRGAARQPEDVLDPFAFQAADQRLGPGLRLGDGRRLGGRRGGLGEAGRSLSARGAGEVATETSLSG